MLHSAPHHARPPSSPSPLPLGYDQHHSQPYPHPSHNHLAHPAHPMESQQQHLNPTIPHHHGMQPHHHHHHHHYPPAAGHSHPHYHSPYPPSPPQQHPHLFPAGAAYRNAQPPPLDFASHHPLHANGYPTHPHAHIHGHHGITPKLEHPEHPDHPDNHDHANNVVAVDANLPLRGLDNTADRLTIDTSHGALAVAQTLAAQDEPIKWFWTFDGDGKPKLAKFDLKRCRRPTPEADDGAREGPSHALGDGANDDIRSTHDTNGFAPTHLDASASTFTSASASASASASTIQRNPLPPSGNRGFKLRPQGPSHHAPLHTSSPSSSSSAVRITSAIDPDDELVTAHAPKWNAFGRLAPWVSGITGPLTGQGEEEIGPSGLAGGEEGQVGERRPRRGDRETNDRLRLRIAALQRAGVRSLLTSPPPRRRQPRPLEDGGDPSQSQQQEQEHPPYAGSSRPRSPSPLLPPSPRPRPRGPAASLLPDASWNTSSLAPILLQPILSPIDLLESRTLKHTFRNPHLQALAKTTLELGESEAEVRKCVGGLWAALEEEEFKVGTKRKRPIKKPGDAVAAAAADQPKGPTPTPTPSKNEKKKRKRSRNTFSPSIIGAEGASDARSIDELNPAFARIEDLFVTHEDGGLRLPVAREGIEGEVVADAGGVVQGAEDGMIPPQAAGDADVSMGEAAEAGPSSAPHDSAAEAGHVEGAKGSGAPGGTESQGPIPVTADQQDPLQPGAPRTPQMQPPSQQQPQQETILLPPIAQREIVVASMSCIHELELDSAEFSARLQEVRGRISEVARKRDNVWRALRIWAVRRVERQLGVKDEGDSDAGEEGGGGGSAEGQAKGREGGAEGAGGGGGKGDADEASAPAATTTTTTTTTTGRVNGSGRR